MRLFLLLVAMFVTQVIGFMVFWSGVSFTAGGGDESKTGLGMLLFFGAPVVTVILYRSKVGRPKGAPGKPKSILLIILVALLIPLLLVADRIRTSWYRYQLQQESNAARERFQKQDELYRARQE